MRIFLRDVHTEAGVGIHPWEKHPERLTRLVVNVEVFAAGTRPTKENGAPLIDYDPIRAAIRAWPTRPHTAFLETLAESLVSLCFEQKSVSACRVTVEKPDIFNEAKAAGVEIFRIRS